MNRRALLASLAVVPVAARARDARAQERAQPELPKEKVVIVTRDGARQLRVARAVRSGQVFINNYGAGGGVELPFGGVKHSGHGREKGFAALHDVSALRTTIVKHG